MKAPVGAFVRLFYDGKRLEPNDYLQTTTGRLYRVMHLRVQARGKHRGRQHLECLVASAVEPGRRVLSLYWYARGRKRARPTRRRA